MHVAFSRLCHHRPPLISPASGGALPIGSSEHLSRGSLPCGVASVVSRWVVCSPKLHYFPAQDMSTPRARSAFVAVASTSAAALAVWRVLQWRARRKARIVAERAARMVQDGAMIDCTDKAITTGLIETATNRASKWLSYQSIDSAQPMIGQVGGISFNKRRVLALPPDYVLKPLHTDHRGFREVGFYEAVKMASQHGRRGSAATTAPYSSKKNGDDGNASYAAIEKCDAWAMTLAMFLHDAIVAESEHTVVASWKALQKEIDLLKSMAKLTAQYYGVVAQNVSSSNPNEVPSTPRATSDITTDSYLLLSDLTANFSKPCAIDIKIGRQSYEPNASEEKKQRETAKYPTQYEQGFRIVGVRIFDSDHPESDPEGFRQLDKHFGRSLGSRELVKDALRTFFTSHCHATAYNEMLASRPRRAISSQSLSSLASMEQPQPKKTMLRARALSNVLQQLRSFQRWFEDNKCLAFYSSSIFIVYEGDPNASNKDLCNVKMIDFGHVVRQAGGDPGYLYGVKRLSNMLTEVLEEDNDNKVR